MATTMTTMMIMMMIMMRGIQVPVRTPLQLLSHPPNRQTKSTTGEKQELIVAVTTTTATMKTTTIDHEDERFQEEPAHALLADVAFVAPEAVGWVGSPPAGVRGGTPHIFFRVTLATEPSQHTATRPRCRHPHCRHPHRCRRVRGGVAGSKLQLHRHPRHRSRLHCRRP
jgi:hypothetical protein